MERPLRACRPCRSLGSSRATPMTVFWPRCANAPIRFSMKPCMFGSISERLADRFGTRGLPVTLSTACASGATAIQLGVEAIRQGRTDRALTVATDGSVSAEALIRFALAFGALHPERSAGKGLKAFYQGSRRFRDRRRGGNAGAGIARSGRCPWRAVSTASSRAAAKRPIIFHRTRSSPDGGPAIATIRAALADAGMDESGIGYINAHGTSTPENDKMEYHAMSAGLRRGACRRSRSRPTSR